MKSIILKITLLFLLSPICYAHTGDPIINHWWYGALHPLTGFDHLLTLIAIGMLAARNKHYKKLLLPGVFLSGMMTGFIFSISGNSFGMAETVIASSLILLGAWLISGKQLNDALVLIAVSISAIAHGYAHGTEVSGSTLQYLSGFLATAFVLILVTLLAFRFTHPLKNKIQSVFGAAIAALGFVYLLQG